MRAALFISSWDSSVCDRSIWRLNSCIYLVAVVMGPRRCLSILMLNEHTLSEHNAWLHSVQMRQSLRVYLLSERSCAKREFINSGDVRSHCFSCVDNWIKLMGYLLEGTTRRGILIRFQMHTVGESNDEKSYPRILDDFD